MLRQFSRSNVFRRNRFMSPSRPLSEDLTAQWNIRPDRFNLFQIAKIINLTHNIKMFRISLPSPEAIVNYKSIPSNVVLKTDEKSNMKNGMHYSPISYSDEKGYVDILVKNNVEDDVAQHLHSMSEGEFVNMKGPFSHDCFRYDVNMRRTIHMIAGGSGISVMLQIIREIFRRQDEDKTCVRLLYATASEADVALRVALDDLHFNLPDRFEVTYLFENEIKGSDSVLSHDYLPRFSDAALEDTTEGNTYSDDDDEFDYVLMPQTIKSNVTPEVVRAFLADSFSISSENDNVSEPCSADYEKPLVLVSAPPRMVELLCGRSHTKFGNRQRSRPDMSSEKSSNSEVGGILGELNYTGDMVATF